MNETMRCAYSKCETPEVPVTEKNGGYMSKWIDGKKVKVACVHEKCRDKWADENNGTIFEAVVP
jgi:hypothetical protein